jgi:DNA invertase Pin-like site-specific DNA recombinase
VNKSLKDDPLLIAKVMLKPGQAAGAKELAIVIWSARLSSLEQSTARQLDGVQLDRVFMDKLSGKDTNRPQLDAALTFLREGDVLIVHSMDRLARNLDDLRKIVLTLTKRGVSVRFMKRA